MWVKTLPFGCPTKNIFNCILFCGWVGTKMGFKVAKKTKIEAKKNKNIVAHAYIALV